VVYPLPSNGILRISCDALSGKKVHFALFNVSGKKVREENYVVSKFIEVNRNNLPAGAYFFKIDSGKGEVAQGKIVFAE